MSRLLLTLGLLAAALAVNACTTGVPSVNPDAPVPGVVTDRTAFDRFIATRPTPERFRRVYPDVLLVMPIDIATKELRLNHSRYFAQLDGEGRISGGRFM